MSTLGTIVLELPPQPGNPRNSEGAFLNLKDGRLLFVYSRFQAESSEDVAPAVIAARTSADGGNTWSGDRILFEPKQFDRGDKPCQNLMSCSLMRMEDGALGLYFGVRYDFLEAKLHLVRSYDEGETFGPPVCCIPAEGYYVCNNDRVIRTKTGRILLPGNFHRVKAPLKSQYDYRDFFDYRGIGCFFCSDDDGRTFREVKGICYAPFNAGNAGLQETGIVELQSGVIWAFFRTDVGCQYCSYSLDNGETWTVPAASGFTSPVSPMSVKQAPNGALLAVWNPVPAYQTRGESGYNFARTPLVAAVSRDDGATWSEPKIIEEGKGGYCYVAIHFEGERVLLQYCAGQPEDGGCLNRLRIKAIELHELGI